MRTRLCCYCALLLASPALLRAADENVSRALAGANLLVGTLADAAKNKIDFSGNASFSADALRAAVAEQIREIQEKGLTPARADDTAFYIGAFYRKAGYSKAAVEYEIHGDRLLIKIAEGPRSLLRKLIFAGNASIPPATLYDYMIGATPERLAKEPDQFPYTAAEISAGADRVRGLYLSEGFLDVAIDASSVQLSQNDTRADVTIRVTEGKRYTFGDVAFAGDTVFPREQLVNALGDSISGPFSPGRVNAMRLRLQSYFKAHGYYQAEVLADADAATAAGGKVPVTFTIHPQSLFRFGGIMVRNETEHPRLRGDFLAKRFAHLKGEIYDPEKLDETFREMLRTGLFDNLRVTPVAAGGNEVRLDFAVSEAKAKELGFTLGYGSYEGATAGFRIGDRDLFGHGRPLTFSADYSQRGLRGEFLYVDPWLFDSRFALRVRLYSQTRDEQGYSKNEIGSRLDLSQRLLPHLELGVFAEGQTVKVTASTIDPTLLGPTNYTLATVGITQSTDYRSDPINPETGFILTSAIDFASLDGQPAFARGTIRFSYYRPLGPCMLALGARAGYIAPLLDEIPIDIRFFNGGGTSVRSFAERQLGPRDTGGNPLGGDFYTVFNAELVFPLYGGLQGAAFVDAGSLRNSDVPGSGDLRYGIGAGLRYKLPIGPLRLDYGFNPDRRPGEDIGAFHFSFGFAF
jgi:outer membrane protein assembly complex protein YaeT